MKTLTTIITTMLLLSEISLVHADNLYTSSNLGYGMYLPDNWVVESVSDTQDFMYDTTGTCGGLLSIIRQRRNTLDFPQPEDWVRAHFVAYLLVVEYSYDPWGSILYQDSSQTCTQGDLWAPEAFGQFYSLDSTMGSWSEFVRFTADDEYGYQLYAISDTADMKTYLTTYASLLYGISIESGLAARPARFPTSVAGARFFDRRMAQVALTGRLVPFEMLASRGGLTAGLVCRPGLTTITGIK